jgi:Flp pilus assembly protein TadG
MKLLTGVSQDGRWGSGSPDGGLARDRRGAVYVEFLTVFFPILTFFLSLVQFAFLQTAAIVVQHAAMRGVRVMVTTIYDNPDYYNGDGQGVASPNRIAPALEAAQIPLAGLGNMSSAVVKLDKPTYGRNDVVTMTVEYEFICRVPLGRIAVCGPSSRKKLYGQASLPAHGAEFIY